MIIPLAQTIATDDLGWVLAENDSETGGPHRLHSNHKITKDDYIKYINIAKALGTRFLGGFVIGEWDRENTCAKACYNKPESPINITEHGTEWNNEELKSILKKLCNSGCPRMFSCSHKTPETFYRKIAGNALCASGWQFDYQDLLKIDAAYIEFGLHGVRHGHYEEGKNITGEWAYRPKEGAPTPWDPENKTSFVICDCFKEILRQYYTEEELPFPESFIPPSHVLYTDPESDVSTCAVLSKYGVKYATLRYTTKNEIMPHFTKFGLFDHNVFMIDRRPPREVSFDKDSCKPPLPPRPYPFIETHFNNLWGVEEYWKKYLSLINLFPTRMIAKNTENVFSQWVYRKYVKISKGYIDFSSVPQEFYDKNIVSNLVLKTFVGPFHLKVKSELSVCGYYKDKYGYAYVTLADMNEPMGRGVGKYKLSCKLTTKKPYDIPDNSRDTYCLYGGEECENCLKIRLKIYRRQSITIPTKREILKVESSNPKVQILGYDFGKDYVKIDLQGVSMIGDETELKLRI